MNPVEVNKNPKQEKSGSHCIKKKKLTFLPYTLFKINIFSYSNPCTLCVLIYVYRNLMFKRQFSNVFII